MKTPAPWLDSGWPNSAFVARRYDRLAPFYRIVRVLFGEPPGLRRKAVERLRLSSGDTVLEVGCGSGRNLRHLVAAVGPYGRVLGIDVSAGMLERARRLATQRGWSNVTLLWDDAAGFDPPADLDAILFSFSYSVMPEPFVVLRRCWERLSAGGRLVIVDAGLPDSDLGRVMRPSVEWLRRWTILGDPDCCRWDDLARLAPHVHTERLPPFGSYFISSVTKR